MRIQQSDELKVKIIKYPDGFRFGAGNDVIVSSEVLQKYLATQQQELLDRVMEALPEKYVPRDPNIARFDGYNKCLDDVVSAIKKIQGELK